MSIREDLINEIIGIIIIVMSFISAWLLMDYNKFTSAPLFEKVNSEIYELKTGSTVNSVAIDFENKGWIKHKEFLKVYARLNDLGSIKAGEYLIDGHLSITDVMKKFVDGQVILHQITLIEGWTFKQMMVAINQHEKIKHTLSDLSAEQIMETIGKPELHPEGQFLPDTYTFSKNTTDINLLKNVHFSLVNTLASAWESRQQDLPLETPYQALTLASIVEKETGVAHERPLIAGVFASRLRKNMKLQTDPTVIYGMGERYNGNIKRKHLKENTPYNTYFHRGLTPTPISMAGQAAIEAVMHPKEEGYLYFVSKGDGSHYFSKTLKEHNQAVRKYQLKK